MSVAGRSVTDGSFRVAARLTATAGDSRKLPARALASSRESTSIRSATSPAQAPAKYFCCSSAERSSRAVKNRSFARGFQVVMVGVRLGRICPHLSVREIRAVCARKKNDTRKFVAKLETVAGVGTPTPGSEYRPRPRSARLGTRFWGQLFRQLAEEPGSAQRPEAVGAARAEAPRLGPPPVRQASQGAELDPPARLWVPAPPAPAGP